MKNSLYYAFVLLIAFISCTKDDVSGKEDDDTKSKLTGVWKVTGFRMAGANLMDYCPLSYLLIDADEGQAVMMTTDSDQLLSQKMEFQYDDKALSLDNLECTYQMTENDNTLELNTYGISIMASPVLAEEGSHEIHITLDRDLELEKSTIETRGFFSWLAEKVVTVATFVYKKVTSNIIDPLISTISYEPWSNTRGWKPENWMSLLPDSLPICCVNLPGTHDSGTASVDELGKTVNADCQTYSILEQFEKGSRYFDMRVGCEFAWLQKPLYKRLPNTEEQASAQDLMLYHGNFCCGVGYRESLEMLAKKITEDKTEFIFVNTQWEDMSYGLLDMAALYVNDWMDETEMRSYFVDSLKHIALDIANRLQREINAKYNDSLFLPYTSDLTVSQARGHIILMEGSHSDACSLQNPQCSYIFSWPDNECRYATIAPFSMRKEISRNIYVQSKYEMKLSEDAKITSKKESARKVAAEVASRNYQGDRILGFNAMNANSGASSFYDLDTYEFAHIFNGFAFDMFVENMKNATVGKDRYYGGIVTLDHFGAKNYVSAARMIPVQVYGDYLSWAVIESNFYGTGR